MLTDFTLQAMFSNTGSFGAIPSMSKPSVAKPVPVIFICSFADLENSISNSGSYYFHKDIED